MGRRGSLTTSEKLASKNPAQRRAGQKEAAAMSSSKRASTVSKAKSIAGRGYTSTVTPSEVKGPTQTQVTQAQTQTVSTTISTKAAAVQQEQVAAQAQKQAYGQYIGTYTTYTEEQLPSGMVQKTAGVSITGPKYEFYKKEDVTTVDDTRMSFDPFQLKGPYGTPLLKPKKEDWMDIGRRPGQKYGAVIKDVYESAVKDVRVDVTPAQMSKDMYSPAISKVYMPTAEEKRIMRTPEYEAGWKEAKTASMADSSWLARTGASIVPGGELLISDTAKFEASMQTSLKEAGYSVKQQEYASKGAVREFQSREKGEIGMVLAANVASELIGGYAIGKQFTKLGALKGPPKAIKWAEAGAIAKGLAPAGAFEGATVYAAEKISAKQDITTKGVLGSAALGATMATVIGLPIAMRFKGFKLPKIKQRVFTGSQMLKGAYVADVAEYPADVIAGGISKAAGWGVPAKIPVTTGATVFGTLYPAPSPTTTSQADTIRTYTRTNIWKSPVKATTRTPAISPIPTFLPTTTTTPVPTTIPIPSTTITPVPTFTPTTTVTPVPTPITPFVPTPVVVPVPTPVPTPLVTAVTTPVTIADQWIPTGVWPSGFRGFKAPKVSTFRLPKARYSPSLAGLSTGFTIREAPSFVTGIGIRYPLEPKKKKGKRKKKKRGGIWEI